MSQYYGLIFISIFAAGFLFFMLGVSIFLGPVNKTKTKQLPFECGSVSIGDVSRQRFHVGFYLVAVIFIIFDIEVVFFYPWALVLKKIGYPALIQMGIFVSVLFVGLVYVWRRGILDWND